MRPKRDCVKWNKHNLISARGKAAFILASSKSIITLLEPIAGQNLLLSFSKLRKSWNKWFHRDVRIEQIRSETQSSCISHALWTFGQIAGALSWTCHRWKAFHIGITFYCPRWCKYEQSIFVIYARITKKKRFVFQRVAVQFSKSATLKDPTPTRLVSYAVFP